MNNLVEVSEQLVVAANLEGKRLEQVRSFGYLGSLVSDDIKCDSEIRSRIAMGKAAFGQTRKIFKKTWHRYANEDAIARNICMVSVFVSVREMDYQQRNEEQPRGG